MTTQTSSKRSNPLGEVFGFPTNNHSKLASHHRENKLCPYNNIVPNCTKSSRSDPIGVCSLFDGEQLTTICPIRFRENWVIAADAAKFLFPGSKNWTTFSEIRLNDKHGNSAGNIDLVIVSYDNDGNVLDFGGVEIQSVYITGNLSNPFKHYLENPKKNHLMDWSSESNYPKPDYLSSTRKRLAPQLIYKGSILKAWKKKTAVVTHESLFETLPKLPEVSQEKADMAWLVYKFVHNGKDNVYNLVKSKTVYTEFKPALNEITQSEPGKVEDFLEKLQDKLNKKMPDLENNPPDDEPNIPKIF